MDDLHALAIADALGREPGVIYLRVQVGNVSLSVHGHPMMTGFCRDYPAEEDAVTRATSEALILAINEGLALVIEFEPAP